MIARQKLGHSLAERLEFLVKIIPCSIKELSWKLELPEQTVRTWYIGRVPRANSPVWERIEQLEQAHNIDTFAGFAKTLKPPRVVR